MTPEITTHSQALEALRTYERKLKAELGVELAEKMMDPIREYIRKLFDPSYCPPTKLLMTDNFETPIRNVSLPPLKDDEAA